MRYSHINREHLIAILRVLLDIDDMQVMKYTIESIVEELEDSRNQNNTNALSRDMNDFEGDL